MLYVAGPCRLSILSIAQITKKVLGALCVCVHTHVHMWVCIHMHVNVAGTEEDFPSIGIIGYISLVNPQMSLPIGLYLKLVSFSRGKSSNNQPGDENLTAIFSRTHYKIFLLAIL